MPLNGSTKEKSIYITPNTRPCPGEYHWGLILTDSNKKPVLHHATNRAGPWSHEERKADPDQSMSLIVLVRVDKIKSHSRATNVIRSIPAEGNPSQRTGEAFDCQSWVKDVLVALYEHGQIELPTDIDTLEEWAVAYGLKYAGRAELGRGATVVNDPSKDG